MRKGLEEDRPAGRFTENGYALSKANSTAIVDPV
jgi:hypothetical protein